ncbi:Hydrolase, haloacid dehalogenase-like family [Streptococcus sp. DD10]|uniref:Cof-type HAD-IIB family hydrolase n=1 Tax=Streptococcus sp. DD10 TaxID=1777878 RepID=UPI000798C161|nr:Cof-type HAD-IIB family hydrolase [Streptococcus sp. DD10]KXT74561.1 Hydrolase, haloacid dehalogenase-like family [Streptococcus sp. DD10]
MTEIKAIISDIDGTILTDHHQIDDELLSLLPQLTKKKIPFVLASARSPLGMAPIVHRLGLENQPIASYNGALIQLNQEILFQHLVDKSEIRQIIQLITDYFPSISINIYSGQNWFTNHINKWTQLEANITGETPLLRPLLDPILDTLIPIHKLLLIGEPKLIQELQQQIGALKLSLTTIYLSKENYLEVTANVVSKEQALKEIARYYQLDLNQIMTIGDNFNDIPMIQLAGLGVAMGNAPKEVKSAANRTTLSNNQHGVARAIEQYVLT